MQIDEIEQLIKASAFRNENKEVILKLAAQLQRTQSVDKAVRKLEKAGYQTTSLLDRFDKLGISPIPLRKTFAQRSCQDR